MSHIEDRWWKDVADPTKRSGTRREKKKTYGKGMRYRVRWTPPGGVEQSESFPDGHKWAAENFKKEIDLSLLAGTYTDPRVGEKPFYELVDSWVAGTSADPVTRDRVTRRVNGHIRPFFVKRYGTVTAGCTEDAVKDWLAWLSRRGLELSVQSLLFSDLSSIMSLAVRSRMVPDNPCRSKGITAPKPIQRKIIPWTAARASTIWSALPEYARLAVPLGAGLGLRIGEICGLSPHDFRRRDGVVDIQRQVRVVPGGPVFSPPKGGKTRVVPVADEVFDEVEMWVERRGATAVSLPYRTLNGRMETFDLLMVGLDGTALHASRFLCGPWRTAFKNCELTQRRYVDGPHALRHMYASEMLGEGVSINDLAEYLGHHNASVTLRYYAHMLPSSHAKARMASTALLGSIRDTGVPDRLGDEGDS